MARRSNHDGTWKTRKDGLIEFRRRAGVDTEGREIRLSAYGRTQTECRAKMDQKIAELRALGGRRQSDPMTVADWLERWVERRRRDAADGTLSARTLQNYEDALRRHVTPAFGVVRLDELRVRDGDAWLRELDRKGVSADRRRYTRGIVVAALNDALRLELIERNALALVRAPNVRRRELAPWDVAEALAFLEAAREDRFAALWVLALTVGARPHELLGLRPVDVAGGKIVIAEQLTHGGNERARTKTPAGRRTIALTPLAEEALRVHRARILAEGLRASPWLFPGPTGKAMNYRNLVARHFEKIVARAGVRRVRPYDLRHTYATLALAAGVPLHVVSRSLGHTSAGFTAKTYAHVVETLEQQHVDRVQALFAPPARVEGSASG
jgi:integrase